MITLVPVTTKHEPYSAADSAASVLNPQLLPITAQ